VTFNPLTGPLHAAPAGHVGYDAAEQAARDAMRLEILLGREASGGAALEQKITRRLAERRSPAVAVEATPPARRP
jgi:hypothetical protein